MTDDERNLNPDVEDAPEVTLSEDDMRFAPQPDASGETSEPDKTEASDSAVEAKAENDVQDLFPPDANIPVTDGMDIEAALAAVSTLSDMLAEQEAAEQARLAQAEAEAQAAAERQARLEHPERFFPVPPVSSLHRGQMASVVPALLLIVVGVWLTFTLTTTKSAPDLSLTAGIILGSFGLVLIVHWLTTGRWSGGSLFFGLTLLLGAGIFMFLLSPASPGFDRGWPLLLAGAGIAAVLTGLLSFPRNTRLTLPGIVLIAAGMAAFAVTAGILGSDIVNVAASLWPAAVVLVAVIAVLPLIRRQRR